jgi:SOS-response transcriptional repressor LexA
MSIEMATADQRRRNFEAFMRARKLKPGTWAKGAEVPTSTVYSFLRGQSDSLGPSTLAKLAKEAGITQADLVAAIEEGKVTASDGKPNPSAPLSVVTLVSSFSPVRVVGAVQAGAWLEALQWDEEQTYLVSIPIPPAYAPYPIFGLEVRGPSMNELYPHKSVVFCVRFLDLQREPRSGERVVVYRRSDDLMESTLKEFIVDDKGVKWLRPRSTSPEFQKSWRVHESAREEQEFEVHALVIGSYRPEA